MTLNYEELLSMHYLLFYEVVEDYSVRRLAFRAAHLAHARRAHQNGNLILAGAFANPVDGAVLLFNADSPDIAAAFASDDPYVRHGLVTRWYVREWTTVVGYQAAVSVDAATSGHSAQEGS
jgi:uncharacterized protein YciI